MLFTASQWHAPSGSLDGGCVREVFVLCPVLQTRTWPPPITLQVMSAALCESTESCSMLKIIPDPPLDPHSLNTALFRPNAHRKA